MIVYGVARWGGSGCDYHRGEDVLVKESRFHGNITSRFFSTLVNRGESVGEFRKNEARTAGE